MPTAVYGFAWTGVEGNRTEGNQVPTHNVRIPILLTADEDGGFVVESLTMPGCISQGDTAEEAMVNIQDAIEGWVQVQREHGHPTSFDATDRLRWIETTI